MSGLRSIETAVVLVGITYHFAFILGLFLNNGQFRHRLLGLKYLLNLSFDKIGGTLSLSLCLLGFQILNRLFSPSLQLALMNS